MPSLGIEHILAGAIGGLFLFAASFKVLDTGPLRETLEDLGLTPPSARLGARALPVFELACGLAVIFFPGSWPSLVLLVGATLGIAGAGVVALRRSGSIRCACFSARSQATLGSRQLVTAVVLAAATGTLVALDASATLRQSLAVLVAVSLLAVVAHIAMALGELRESVHDRRVVSGAFPA
jgi:hypothetical protein